ncbi:hypothetical protein ACNI3Q_12350 [Sphingomonas sp. FW199]|uniref:hypothetical protein n=1 Tax=unclassified Sphingomonas TaxID=196159 RepID=UPI0021A5A553|nr:hypothetical protein [Sphingomonas sp. BGYR3]MDG5488087.1 hypothetical protein [Sphingomonas sp. BGYR3]
MARRNAFSSPSRRRAGPMRPLVIAIIVLVLLVGGIFFLASRSTEKAPVRVEKEVSLENLAQ